MDVEHRKTALDDSSEIYQKRDNSFKRKDIHTLSWKGKLEYFRDYYLVKVIVTLAILLFAGNIVYTMLFNNETCVFSLALLNDSRVDDEAGLTDALTEVLAIENKDDYVTAVNYDLENYQFQIAFTTKVGAGAVDLVICPQDYFVEGAAGGIFADLSEVLPEELYESLSDRILEGRTVDTNLDGTETTYGEYIPCGIDISDCTFLEEFGGVQQDQVLCVVGNAPNLENAQRVIEYLINNP